MNALTDINFTVQCDSVSNMVLMLPPSVGSGVERRLGWETFPHEQKAAAHPQQAERQETEREIEERQSLKTEETKDL